VAGRIRREDVQAVRERARIEDIVGEHVTLKSAGVGSMKGLCPFHDEHSPSFHVRPQVGLWHCFGCGEGGDVISFVQKIDGLPFSDAVEYLASRVGMQLRYEEGGAPRPGDEPGRRQRLLEAHRAAGAFYAEQLATPGAAAARTFLAERGFDRAAAEQFGVGYAPQGWDSLLRYLRGRGFTEAELVATGLMSQGTRGVYDRFRGRLVWPIREVTGDTVGFGARRLFEEDQGPKYLNTPETALYKKSQVLYGIDLAKREIARSKQVVVVEGYTDVMAMHLSGVGTAVATCGTAFGSDHARIVRRLVGDSGSSGGVQLASGASVGGEIIFTFDGDAAGQKAALRAFGEDQSFSAQTFVAIERSGMDPCELRQAQGPDAVRALVAGRTPLFEFVIRSTLAVFDLATAEGRVGALRTAAPVVAGIRDTALRPEYTRLLAGWLGMDQSAVRQAVVGAGRTAGTRRPDDGPGDARRPGPGDPVPAAIDRMPVPDRRDPVARTERTALEVVLQHPALVPDEFDDLADDAFSAPAYRAVHEAIRAAGGLEGAREELAADGARGSAAWVARVQEEAARPVAGLVTELAVAPLPEDRADVLPDYVRGVVIAILEIGFTRHIAELRGRLQRMDGTADPGGYQALFTELIAVENRRRTLRDSG
jgi:DNA primase